MRRWVWWYTAGFLGIFLICHTPGLTDAEGRLLGLFRIDPIDDVVHLLSGLVGVAVAWRAPHLSAAYLIGVGIIYNVDAAVGMLLSRGFLDLSVFRQGPGGPDFSLTNWALNMPHIVLATLALWLGMRGRGATARPIGAA